MKVEGGSDDGSGVVRGCFDAGRVLVRVFSVVKCSSLGTTTERVG